MPVFANQTRWGTVEIRFRELQAGGLHGMLGSPFIQLLLFVTLSGSLVYYLMIKKALKYDPESPAIIDSMGWVLFKRGRYEEALAELERAWAGMQDPEVAAHIVETLVAMDRRDEALERLVAAEEQAPDSDLLLDVRERLFGDAPE